MRYFVTGPVECGYAYWDVHDRDAGHLGPNFSVATFFKDMPGAEFEAKLLCGKLNYDDAQASQREVFEVLIRIERKVDKFMAALDDKIAALQAEVAANTTVEKSAVALLQGLSAQLAAAIAAAAAAGATPAQLQALTDLNTALNTNDQDLANAIAANTPQPPA